MFPAPPFEPTPVCAKHLAELSNDQGRATLTSAIALASIATIGATFVTSWALQAAAMLGGVG